MKAILIDPVEKTVTDIDFDYEGVGYRAIYPLIKATIFDVIVINNKNDSIFIDDEGLYNSSDLYFTFQGFQQPIAGYGLVLGCDGEGETTAPTVSADEIRSKIGFPSLSLSGFVNISGTVDHPILGPNTPMIGHQPVFKERKDD